jgi:phosphoglycolate phosphatase
MSDDRPTFRAVLFDFDGTLADSYPAITASVNHVRAHYGLPPLPVATVKPHVGRGPEYLLSRTVPGGDPVRDGQIYRTHHPHIMHQLTRLLPGADRLTDLLDGRGVRLGLCSNKPLAFSRSLLASFGLAGRFAVVLGPEEVARPKPAPDMLLAALERLAVGAPRALYIGDMTVDVTTARAAGVAVWAVATGSEAREALAAAEPDRLYASLDEIADDWAGAALDSAAPGG